MPGCAEESRGKVCAEIGPRSLSYAACIHPNKHYPALGYRSLPNPPALTCLPQVSVEARSAQVCHAMQRPLQHLLHGHVALRERMTKIGLFPGHRNWMTRCSVKTTAFKQNRHIKPKQTSPTSNGRQGSSRMGSELSDKARETDTLSSRSSSATGCSHPLAGSERLLPGVSE